MLLPGVRRIPAVLGLSSDTLIRTVYVPRLPILLLEAKRAAVRCVLFPGRGEGEGGRGGLRIDEREGRRDD